MARPYHYHVYDRPSFNALAAWASAPIAVPGAAAGTTETKTMYSLKKDMDQLRADGAAKGIVDAGVTSVGTSSGGRSLWALKVGNGASHKVLFTGCHHAREWISVEIPYLVAEYLIQKYTNTPSTPQEKRIKHLLLNRQIWFVPLVNPDGHDFNMRVNRNWRANRQSHVVTGATISRSAANGGDVTFPSGTYMGVDINRNYNTSNWGTETFLGGFAKTSRDPRDGGANSIWCGVAGSGEAESAAIDALIQAQKFRSSITYHSFSELLLFPDASAADSYVQWVGGGMNGLIAASGHSYTYQSGSALYPTTGDLMEFSYEKVPGRPTFTPEVRPDSSANAWPTGPGFSGLPESEIEPTFREHLGAALALINCAGFNAVAASQNLTLATGSPPTKGQMVRNCWEVFQGWAPYVLQLCYDLVESPIGTVVMVCGGEALQELYFLDRRPETTAGLPRTHDPLGCAARIRAYFDGDFAALDGIAVNPTGTPFQQTVWKELRGIPPGQTETYGHARRTDR